MTNQPRPFRDRLNAWLSRAGIHFHPKNLGDVFYFAASVIGWIGYTVASLFLALILGFYVLVLEIMSNPANEIVFMRGMGQILYWLFIVIIRLFSGFMGWGADVSVEGIFARIFGSILTNAPPSRVSFYWFLPTAVLIIHAITGL